MSIETKEIITLTKAAKDRIKFIMSKAKNSYEGLRIGIDNKGGSGHSYKIEYAKNRQEGDEEICLDDIKIYVEPSATMYIHVGPVGEYQSCGTPTVYTVSPSGIDIFNIPPVPSNSVGCRNNLLTGIKL